MLDQTSIDNVLNPLSFSNHRFNPEQPLQDGFQRKEMFTLSLYSQRGRN